jgi:hypothetical protein
MTLVIGGIVLTLWAVLAQSSEYARLLGAYTTNRLLVLVGLTYLACWGAYALLGAESVRRASAGLLLSVLSAFVAVALLELPAVLGWIDYRQLISPPHSVMFTLDKPWERPTNRFDPELLSIHRPGIQFSGNTAGDLVNWLGIATDRRYEVSVQYDQNGFRNPRALDRADIAAIGDSFIEAGLVGDRDIVTSRLADAFGLQVANLGQGGYGPQQELIVLQRYALPLNPKLVIWFLFEGNDLLDVHRYEQLRADARNPTTSGSFLSRSATANSLRTLRWLLTPTPSADLPEAVRRSCRLRRSQPSDAETIYFAYPGAALTERDLSALSLTQQTLVNAQRAARQAGAEFVLVLIPTKFRVYHELCEFPAGAYGHSWRPNDLPGRLAALAGAIGMPYLDLTIAFRAAAENGPLTYFPDDGHWNASGHAVAADAVVEFVRSRGLLAND